LKIFVINTIVVLLNIREGTRRRMALLILRFFFGGMSYGLLDLADLEHSDDLIEKFLVCWLVFGLLVLIGLNTERTESNDALNDSKLQED
jgi:FtsH-binding integral membrane protein